MARIYIMPCVVLEQFFNLSCFVKVRLMKYIIMSAMAMQQWFGEDKARKSIMLGMVMKQCHCF